MTESSKKKNGNKDEKSFFSSEIDLTYAKEIANFEDFKYFLSKLILSKHWIFKITRLSEIQTDLYSEVIRKLETQQSMQNVSPERKSPEKKYEDKRYEERKEERREERRDEKKEVEKPKGEEKKKEDERKKSDSDKKSEVKREKEKEKERDKDKEKEKEKEEDRPKSPAKRTAAQIKFDTEMLAQVVYCTVLYCIVLYCTLSKF